MRQLKNPLLVFAVLIACFSFWVGCQTSQPPAVIQPVGATLQPSPNAPRIAFVASRLLEEFHYSQHPLDTELSKKFFDEYVDSLDPRHEHFFQSDLEEFSTYRTNLDKLTTGNGQNLANLKPAFVIYERYAERFQQHVAYANELLAQDKFKFNSDEKILLDRRKEPFPKNLEEAKALWRQRLRYEYLMEKLAKEISETNGLFTVKLPPGASTNITATLAKRYRGQLHNSTNWDGDKVLAAYLNSLAHAYDPHSDYFSANKAQDFSMQMNLSLFGIGAKLQSDEDGYCTIKELVPGGPAKKSKLIKLEDRIVSVAQAGKPAVDVVDMDLEKIVQLIRGPKNTEVRLTISPAEDRTLRREIKLVRDEIKLEDSEAKAKIIEQPNGQRLGIISLPSFYAPVDLGSGRATPKYTSQDTAKLLKKLKQENVSGVILDLRYNPGGSLEEAVKFTGLFIKDGPVVLARNPDGQVMVDSDPDPSQEYDGPLVVLVNRFSASASEIAAAALQDYGRAIVIGDISTHGKGTVQNLNPLKPFVWPANNNPSNDPGTIKITIRKFYRISGASTQFKGVVPDIILPDTLNHSTYAGESALDNALPWDTIQPVNYDKYGLVEPYLAQLKARSDARIATNVDYSYVKQDIDQYLKFQMEKTASLNENASIKERERVALQNKARDKERNARPDDGAKHYEITLQNAGLPGLPAPLPESKKAETASIIPKAGFYAYDTNSFRSFFNTNGTRSNLTSKVEIINTTNTTGTNSLASDTSVTNTISVDTSSKPEANKPGPGSDPMLDESLQILTDYISLLNQPNKVAVKQ